MNARVAGGVGAVEIVDADVLGRGQRGWKVGAPGRRGRGRFYRLSAGERVQPGLERRLVTLDRHAGSAWNGAVFMR